MSTELPPLKARSGWSLSGVLQVALLLLVVQFEPGIIGHNYGPGHLVLMIGVLACLLVVERLSPVALLTLASRRPEILLFVCFFALIMAHDFSRSPHLVLMSGGFLGKALVGLAAIVTLGAIMPVRRQFLVLAWFFALQGASLAVSHVAIAAGHLDTLFICEVASEGYEGNLRLYAPWSLFYQQSYAIGGSVYPRAVGFYREPGNFQAFAATGLIAAVLLHRWWLAALVAIGMAASLSSAALLTVIALVGWRIVLAVRSQRAIGLLIAVVTVAVLAAMVPFFYELESVGFRDKLSNESGQDRLISVGSGVDQFLARPWLGIGMYNEDRFRNGLHGVNLLAGLGALGLVGMALLHGAVIVALIRNHSLVSLTLCLPILVTMATSQPLYYGIFLPWLVCLPVIPLARARAALPVWILHPTGLWRLQNAKPTPVRSSGQAGHAPPPDAREGDLVVLDEEDDEVPVRARANIPAISSEAEYIVMDEDGDPERQPTVKPLPRH